MSFSTKETPIYLFYLLLKDLDQKLLCFMFRQVFKADITVKELQVLDCLWSIERGDYKQVMKLIKLEDS